MDVCCADRLPAGAFLRAKEQMKRTRRNIVSHCGYTLYFSASVELSKISYLEVKSDKEDIILLLSLLFVLTWGKYAQSCVQKCDVLSHFVYVWLKMHFNRKECAITHRSLYYLQLFLTQVAFCNCAAQTTEYIKLFEPQIQAHCHYLFCGQCTFNVNVLKSWTSMSNLSGIILSLLTYTVVKCNHQRLFLLNKGNMKWP